MVTPIEMKQEQAQSNPEGESSEDGMKAGLLIQLAERGSWTARSIQLADGRVRRLARSNSTVRRVGLIQLVERHPASFRANLGEDCPSRSCMNGLAAIRSFCGVPESMEFRLPVSGEVAEFPQDGYFTDLSFSPTPDGLCTVRDLLHSGPSYWASFTLKQVRHAVALHCSRFQPGLPVEEGEESSMESGESTSMCSISPYPLSFAIGGRSPGFFRVGAGVISSGFFPHGFPCALSDRSEGVAKSSLLPRIRVVSRGRTTMVIAVKFPTCLARELMTLSRSANFFSKVENIFWTSSNAVVLRSSADMFD
ncbi:hypothetical protein DY000_02053077 [Brassica cretica]|uniref:Uncharacterized protein n=1 Tax=Brassica cretica TaxID=69181 RepID=A0ABQ7AK38_BRACR|nr:hypothetical protein DY000_02053077 [Brassica cretica]